MSPYVTVGGSFAPSACPAVDARSVFHKPLKHPNRKSTGNATSTTKHCYRNPPNPTAIIVPPPQIK
eukprot:291235-Rhodomonas_salina.1